MSDVQTKHCPICTKDLPISEFGICRARRDGRNLYCKSRIRQKVSDQRKALKEYKATRRTYAQQQSSLEEQFGAENLWTEKSMWKLSPAEKVKNAIARGFHTQREIRSETKLSADVIGDAIANLLLWTKEIRTQIVDNTRLYFLNEEQEPETNQLVVKGERRIQRVA